MKNESRKRLLTDVVVFMAWAELEAQGEGREQLELLRELQRPVRTHRPVAFPALEAFHVVVAGGVAVVVDHEKDVAFHALLRKGVLVVRTVDVQVVVDGHLHRVFSVHESEETNRGTNSQTLSENVTSFNTTPSKSTLLSMEREIARGSCHSWCRYSPCRL